MVSAMRRGEAPAELSQGSSGPVGVTVHDKGDQAYDPRTAGSAGTAVRGAQVAAFTGEGNALGGTGAQAAVNKDAATATVGQSQPVTKLQIRFHDGQRKVVNFVCQATPGASIVLM